MLFALQQTRKFFASRRFRRLHRACHKAPMIVVDVVAADIVD